MNYLFKTGTLDFSLAEDQVVRLPVANNLNEFFNQFTFPDFSAITNIEVWKTGVVMAIVASLETLLCVEATDKLDPDKRITPTNRELKAQGLRKYCFGIDWRFTYYTGYRTQFGKYKFWWQNKIISNTSWCFFINIRYHNSRVVEYDTAGKFSCHFTNGWL